MAFSYHKKTVLISEASKLPFWRHPIALLILMAMAMPVAFSSWSALLNNFVIEVADFDGVAIGWLHGVREIPGFLAVGVIFVLYILREQPLAVISLIALGAATAVTAWFPSFSGLLVTTLIGSLGFHYYETVNQSLQLQWLDKKTAPRTLGIIVAVGSAASLVAYVGIVLGWRYWGLTYEYAYLISGGVTVLLALVAWFWFPRFETDTPQIRKMILRKRYWLYYALNFMAGARRQIFLVFAAFMMVERFGFEVHELTALFILNYVANMIFAPFMGGLVMRIGERNALVFEYGGLIIVFALYGGIYIFDWGATLAMALYVVDHLFFALAFALKTYFQKIADPKEIAPTAAVVFTINHIPAVFLPVALGYLWIFSPGAVFVIAALMAVASLALALQIPRHPVEGNETIWSKPKAA
jgi:hypothetical protein